jgi:hypothetical protein
MAVLEQTKSGKGQFWSLADLEAVKIYFFAKKVIVVHNYDQISTKRHKRPARIQNCHFPGFGCSRTAIFQGLPATFRRPLLWHLWTNYVKNLDVCSSNLKEYPIAIRTPWWPSSRICSTVYSCRK